MVRTEGSQVLAPPEMDWVQTKIHKYVREKSDFTETFNMRNMSRARDAKY